MATPKKANLKKATDTATADTATTPSVVTIAESVIESTVTTSTTALRGPSGPIGLSIGDRKGLARILGTLASVADGKSTMPMLAHVLIRTGMDGTTLAATDLALSAVYRAPAWIGGTGGRCVPARDFADIVKRMPRTEIEIRGTEHGIVVASGKVQSSMLGLPDRDFPTVPDRDVITEWQSVDVASLLGVIAPTIDAVCKDETRFHLNGVYLETDAGWLRAVSTDGHRLHKAQAACSLRLAKGLIVPTKALKILSKSLVAGACEIGVKDFMLFVRQGGWTFAIKTIDAQFPPYEQVIPDDRKRFLTVHRTSFIGAMERALLRASDARGVRLTATDQTLRVLSDNPDTGSTEERFPCEFQGEWDCGANVKYLIASLKVIDDDRVTFACGSELDPILLRGSEDMGTRSLKESALVCVVMPMRI